MRVTKPGVTIGAWREHRELRAVRPDRSTSWTPKAEKAEFWNTSFFSLRGGTL
jgi:hypothetical protein